MYQTTDSIVTSATRRETSDVTESLLAKIFYPLHASGNFQNLDIALKWQLHPKVSFTSF